MKKVRRALKTLGVNFYEFDDKSGDDGTGGKLVVCEKEFCRLGCVCETLASKPVATTHCGKAECMFRCCCSEEALKIAAAAALSPTGTRRAGSMGISAEGCVAKLRSTNTRRLAAEERKFNNTVVAATGSAGSTADYLMLGATSGRQRRERKVPTRYQDSDVFTAELAFVAGAKTQDLDPDFDETQVRSFSRRCVGDDAQAKRMMSECIRNQTITRCAVLVPLIKVPEDTKVWCMYHCQYGCPCSDFKNPLDFGPDLTASRNMSKRATGSTFKTKKRRASDALQPPKTQKQRKVAPVKISLKASPFDVTLQSARTSGAVVRKNQGHKTPHHVVVAKKNAKVKGKATKAAPPMHERPKVESTDHVDQEQLKSLTPFISKDLSLPLKPKGTVQYMKWGLIKHGLDAHIIKIWVFHRSSRPVLFLTKSNVLPYYRNATDLQVLVKHNGLKGLPLDVPPIIKDILLKQTTKEKEDKFAILNSNGLAWEVTGMLQKKPPVDPAEDEEPPPEAGQQQQQQQQNSNTCVINLETKVQKLPLGQSLVTLVRGTATDQPVMQIKLPVAMKHQHWSIIKVDVEQGSVQCPDSNLALKVGVLKEAADVALRENTTVRIPIPYKGEQDIFGVYAVPGLQSHVFVGPFSKKVNGPPKVITLDDDDDDDEVQEVQPDVPEAAPAADPPPAADPSAAVMKGIIARIADSAVKSSEVKRQQLAAKVQAIRGPVPQIVSNIKDDGEEVVIDLVDETPEKMSPESMPEYLNVEQSKYGTVVINKSESQPEKTIEIVVSGFGHQELKLYPRKVTFPHPRYQSHEVMCTSVEGAKKWIEEYIENKMSGIKNKPTVVDKAVSDDDDEDDEEIDENQRKHMRLTVNNHRYHKQQVKLFYALNQLLKTNHMKKSVNCVQVLSRARDAIELLKIEQMESEQTKKALLFKRAKLFEEFVQKLNHFPVSVKKKALLETKEMLKKIKDQRHAPASTFQQPDPEPATTPLATPTSSPPKADATPQGGLTPYSDVTGLQTVKKDGKVLRPMNAFMLWTKGFRRRLISQGMDGASVSKLLADEWKKLPEEEKQKYIVEAERLKNLHQIQHPNYKYSPKARKQGRMKLSPRSSLDKSPQQLQPPQQQMFNPSNFEIRPLVTPPALVPGPGFVPVTELAAAAAAAQVQSNVACSVANNISIVPNFLPSPQPQTSSAGSTSPNEEKKKNIIEISID